MNDNQPGAMEKLPCGCVMYSVGTTFVFEPHSEDCEYYAYVIQLAQERNKPIETIEF